MSKKTDPLTKTPVQVEGKSEEKSRTKQSNKEDSLLSLKHHGPSHQESVPTTNVQQRQKTACKTDQNSKSYTENLKSEEVENSSLRTQDLPDSQSQTQSSKTSSRRPNQHHGYKATLFVKPKSFPERDESGASKSTVSSRARTENPARLLFGQNSRFGSTDLAALSPLRTSTTTKGRLPSPIRNVTLTMHTISRNERSQSPARSEARTHAEKGEDFSRTAPRTQPLTQITATILDEENNHDLQFTPPRSNVPSMTQERENQNASSNFLDTLSDAINQRVRSIELKEKAKQDKITRAREKKAVEFSKKSTEKQKKREEMLNRTKSTMYSIDMDDGEDSSNNIVIRGEEAKQLLRKKRAEGRVCLGMDHEESDTNEEHIEVAKPNRSNKQQRNSQGQKEQQDNDMQSKWIRENAQTSLLEIPFDQIGQLTQLGPSMRNVPEKLQKEYSRALTNVLNEIVADKENPIPYKKLALINIILLTYSPDHSDNNTMKRDMKDRIDIMNNGQWESFKVADIYYQVEKKTGRNTKDDRTSIDINTYKVQRQIRVGNLSKAAKMATDINIDNTAKPNANTIYNTIMSKNPPLSEYQQLQFATAKATLDSFTPLPEHRVIITEEEVVKCIKGKKQLVSSGIGCLTWELLQTLSGKGMEMNVVQHNFVSALAKVLTIIANGETPRNCLPVLRDNQVIAVGEKSRPISLSGTLRKLISCILWSKNSAVVKTFEGLQYAHRELGLERVVHMLRLKHESHRTLDLFVSDASNAFNLVNKMRALEIIMTKYPGLFPFCRDMYYDSATLFYNTGDEVREIEMQTGVQQGDVLATFIYSIAMLELHEAMQNEVRGTGTAAAFVDDTFTIGTFDQITKVIDILDGDLAKRCGFVRNDSKCIVIMGAVGNVEEARRRRNIYATTYQLDESHICMHPDDVAMMHDVDSEEWKVANGEYGVKVLGSFIGTDAFKAHQLQIKLLELQGEADRLVANTRAQDCLVLLLRCFNLKPYYIMRTMEPAILEPFIHGFTNIQRQIVHHIAGTAIADITFERMKLDIEKGGMGLGFMNEVAHASFVASMVGVQQSLRMADEQYRHLRIPMLQSMERCVARIQRSTPASLTMANVWAEVAPSRDTLQAKFTAVLVKSKLNEHLELINALTDKRAIVNMYSTIDPHAGLWLTVIPKTDPLTMTDLQVSVALRRRFYIEQSISPPHVQCDCNKGLWDKYGVHQLNCNKGRGHQTTHDNLSNLLCGALNKSGFRARQEVIVASWGNGRRADLTIDQLGLGPTIVHTDITVTHSLTGRNNESCNNQTLPLLAKAGWAANNAAAKKIKKYAQLCDQNNSKFIPLVFETSGHMHASILKLITDITKHAANICKIPAHVLKRYYLNTISVILHRCLSDAMISKSAQVLGNQMLPGQKYVMTYDNIMLHDRAYVDHGLDRGVDRG